jgi:hypothetical protein
MDAGPLSGWAAAGISAVSAAGSLIGWWRSRKQARIATQARIDTAADVRRIANAGEARQQTQAERSAAEEVEPWTVDPIPGYDTACYLRNKTGTPKYGIAIAGELVNEPNSFDFIGPSSRKQFGVITGISMVVKVEITWHQREDRSDAPAPQTIVIP